MRHQDITRVTPQVTPSEMVGLCNIDMMVDSLVPHQQSNISALHMQKAMPGTQITAGTLIMQGMPTVTGNVHTAQLTGPHDLHRCLSLASS